MSFLAKLSDCKGPISVEIRPPRVDLDTRASIDSWFATNAAIRSAAAPGRVVFLTDSAVGSPEEENLHHVLTNLEESIPRDLLCPFLTAKHDIEYCLWFAARAVEARLPALVVLGGDLHVGPKRCVPHGADLRRLIRERYPDLLLGGWANPHADPAGQIGYLLKARETTDFFLTQIVTHYDLGGVRRLLAEADRQGLAIPGVFGVFFWRNARPAALKRLARFFPVPNEGLARDFAAGVPAEETAARTVRALHDCGVSKVYVSNLDPNRASRQLRAIEDRSGAA